ncbi:hypothetical protein KCU77_g16760, partial [Aureobasidium melanogenum]
MRFAILFTSLAALTVAVPALTAQDVSDFVITRIAPTSTTPTTPTTSASSTRTKPTIEPYIPEESASCRANICCGKNGRCWRVSPTDVPVKPPSA